ncbi:dolichol-phosphate mannosyltransferase subunit 3 [Fistulina hepatica ATCC 64428]|nr:dolichol-phosphate mannosyltransferase subunit 3 [Fistulina hepatica ATCC 64428]
MTRAQRAAVATALCTSIYVLAFFEVVSVPFLEDSISQQILPVLPWWLLVAFGSYTLMSIGWALFTFRDSPDAYNELLIEITEAKNDLRTKGVDVD